ncbi:uncharacterized protein LAESUDRAFT_738050 [Laetiporus sulphureus 93-53]|uniref:F-box domain-containing protein n=1 Tax=Laetiporus sulphureus 93-53 TaxID=1314785 RepID=A0A165D0R9_9APHY|nr:uncharacterized protein LAESUDRAFT_738050 [Laetiporus sulphureus 93-53]KZT03905.1 hypothetical protein LAESUDRAFT_738050 [Laetiporus sulphureus 93-53]
MLLFDAGSLPVDILPLIFEHLDDRRDLHTCAQLSKSFNAAATPILYRSLDTRIIKAPLSPGRQRPVIIHPARTLLQKPAYAKYVRYVRETGAIYYSGAELLRECYEALRLCTNIEGITWSDDRANGANNDQILLGYINILRQHNLKELTIRTYLTLSEDVWAELSHLKGLHKVALWVMDGPPRILQGWSEKLGKTLTHLELGRCAGVPASILVHVISSLPLMQALRLKGAQTSAILEILTVLPHLVFLDTEYFGSGVSRYVDVPVASLRELTVRTSSVDVQGPQHLWTWIKQLLPRPSLVSFTLNAFSTAGDATMPRHFLLDLAHTHRDTLKHFNADSASLTLEDIECLCTLFPGLESLSCSVALCHDPRQIEDATTNGHNLRQLRLYTTWVPTRYGTEEITIPFEIEHAKNMMLRKGSRLRIIGIGRVVYTRQWTKSRSQDGLELEVVRDVLEDS